MALFREHRELWLASILLLKGKFLFRRKINGPLNRTSVQESGFREIPAHLLLPDSSMTPLFLTTYLQNLTE